MANVNISQNRTALAARQDSACEWPEFDEYVLAPVDIARDTVPWPAISQSAFALKVRGDSMVDSAGGLSFPPGSMIVVDPTAEAWPGDFVVAREPDAKEAIFGMLELDGAQRSLKMLNTLYSAQCLSDGARIAGVVTSVQVSVPRR